MLFVGTMKKVGLGDRGGGLRYRDEPKEGILEQSGDLPSPFIVKVQAPLDNSSDAAGGIGRMPQTTLLLSTKDWVWVRFVEEEEMGHFRLLKAALSERSQVAYLYGMEQRKLTNLLQPEVSICIARDLRPPIEVCGF